MCASMQGVTGEVRDILNSLVKLLHVQRAQRHVYKGGDQNTDALEEVSVLSPLPSSPALSHARAHRPSFL
jgi:hypothetical protein